MQRYVRQICTITAIVLQWSNTALLQNAGGKLDNTSLALSGCIKNKLILTLDETRILQRHVHKNKCTLTEFFNVYVGISSILFSNVYAFHYNVDVLKTKKLG